MFVSNPAIILIPSQLWFFEKYVPLSSEKVHGKRQPGIDDGSYRLQNCHEPGPTVYWTLVGVAPRITSNISTRKTKFSLRYKSANSAEFTLTYEEVSSDGTSTTYHKVADVGRYLGCATLATALVLLKENEDDPGYYICRPDSGYPRKVISSRIFKTDGKTNYFSIDNMVEGNEMQMWKIVSTWIDERNI
ncbi:hypothetical protein BYT27DRAFT_7166921 [Phlegmacium glaucopus]|nr:hypothetical protein BYT27DRAFT_7166921 [Phlegmacium glaucopus]